LQGAQGVLGQAGYGLQSGFNYLDPSAGLGFIQNNAANEMSAYNTALGAQATQNAGIMEGNAGLIQGITGLLGTAAGGYLGNPNLFKPKPVKKKEA
jgi:hypothetical protein